MHPSPDIDLQKRVTRCSRYFAIAVLLIGILVLSGWQWSINILKGPIQNMPFMNPVTALAFILAGISFLLISSANKSLNKLATGYILGAAISLIGTLKILRFPIDDILFQEKLAAGIENNISNRMTPNTAFCFIILGIALIMLNKEIRKKWMPAQLIALIVGFNGLLSVIGFIYHVQTFYSRLSYVPVAIYTAVCFLFISLAIFFANPDKGITKEPRNKFIGGLTVRGLISGVIIILILLSLFRYVDYQLRVFSAELEVVLLVMSIILLMIGIIWYNATFLNKRDFFKKKTEDDLHKSKEMFRLLISNVKDYAIFMIDNDGIVISWNEASQRIKGYSSDEIIGKHISIFYTKDEIDRGEPEYNLQMARTVGRFENQGWRVRKDGSTFWADIVFTAIYNDKKQLQGFAKITRDITERKKAEEKFRSLLETAPDAMIFANEKGEIVLINHQVEVIFGYTKNEIIGQQIDILIPPNLRPGHKQHRSNYFANPKIRLMGIGLELFAIRKDGTQFQVEISLAPIITEEGTLVSASLRDITERKKLEEQLKKFNEQLEEQVRMKTAELTNVFERVSDGFMAFDNKEQITYVNKKAAELNKRTPKDLIGKYILEELYPEEYAIFHQNFYQSITQQRNLHFEMYYAALGIWVENYMYPSSDGLSLFSRDITERRTAEERIIKEKEISDSIINSLPGIFYLFNIHRKFLRWNNNFETISGYNAEEISKMSPLDFFDTEEKTYIQSRIEKVFADGTSDAEANFLNKNKEKSLYYFTGRSIEYEGETCLMGTGIDISMRKKEEEEIRQSEKKYKLLFEQNPMSMWILIPANNSFIDVNDSALNHYGYTRKEFLQLNTEKIRVQEDQNQFLNDPQKNISGISYRGIERHQKKDGSIIHVEIYATDYIYTDKRVQLILSNDISEKINSEKNLKHSYEEIRQLASHLQNIREEERAGIAREIHDELGQQLTGLKMDISWLSKKINIEADGLIEQKINGTLELLDSAIKTVRRIATDLRPSILDDLGLIAAIEWQSQEFEKRSGIITRFESEIDNFSFSPSVAIGLFRICQESLTNVARYAEAKNVFIKLQQTDKQILLTIIDNGKGFDINKIRKKTLGLLGMKERSLMMGGKFEILSEEGKGTSLNVRISY